MTVTLGGGEFEAAFGGGEAEIAERAFGGGEGKKAFGGGEVGGEVAA